MFKNTDSIGKLKKKIGEKMEAAYEIYRGLKNLKASKITRKGNVLNVINSQ